ncbi:MAG: AAA family ATPase [Candidatus Melainabacteria bacterium]|nr:AAA family ATPase [Candidatus Melainabacteria bacterium]
MLKVTVITQQNDTKYWQDTLGNVWEGPLDISLQTSHEVKKPADLIILDFSGIEANTHELLTDISPSLVGKHFLIVSDKKDADLAIEGIRLGAIGFLVKPFKRFELISSLDRLHTAPTGQIPTKRKSRIITMISYKGGTGVSTATVNLAYTLSNVYQKKTLIVDAAGFSNHATVLLNIIPKCTLADICKQGKDIDEQYLTNAVSTIGKNLAIIGSYIKISDVNDINLNCLENFLEIASEVYDYILVDTSTHLLDEVSMFFIQKASDLLLMTTFDLLAIRDNRFYIQTLKDLGISEHKIKPIINRQDWYIGSLEPELIQKQLNHTIFHALPNDWNLCVESANYGRPLLEVAPNSQLATSYKILAGKFTKSDIPVQESNNILEKKAELTDDKQAKKKGILNWF